MGKKIRRRNVLNNYDPKYNVRDKDTENDKETEENLETANEQATADKEDNIVAVAGKEKNVLATDEKEGKVLATDGNEAVEQYKEKLRQYGRQYKEINGLWFNIDDIESVSD